MRFEPGQPTVQLHSEVTMRIASKLYSVLPALGLMLVTACTDSTFPTSPSVAGPLYSQGSGSGGGGGSAILPDVRGVWRGTYHYDFAAFGPVDVTRKALVTITEDASGNLGGSFCNETESPGCYALTGRVQSNGAVQIEFSADGSTGATFRFDGAIAGTKTCADGSTATAMTGTFRVREGSGTFAFSRCQ
jgi:hypothetical protein